MYFKLSYIKSVDKLFKIDELQSYANKTIFIM